MNGFAGACYWHSMSAAAVAAAAVVEVNGDLKSHQQVNSAWILVLKQLTLGSLKMDPD